MKTVLVLNSERHIARLIQVNLERQGIMVYTAGSASDALDVIADHHPDVILTDVSMRFLDGADVFRTLKRNPATWDIPIYVLPRPGDRWPRSPRFPWLPQFTLFEDNDDNDETKN
jgi:CheY-like chemotaxis protein